MSTTDPVITGWDPEGEAMFALEELDHRYEALLERMRAADPVSWSDVDHVVGALLCADLLPHAGDFAEILGELAQRERLRRATMLRERMARTEAEITALSN